MDNAKIIASLQKDRDTLLVAFEALHAQQTVVTEAVLTFLTEHGSANASRCAEIIIKGPFDCTPVLGPESPEIKKVLSAEEPHEAALRLQRTRALAAAKAALKRREDKIKKQLAEDGIK